MFSAATCRYHDCVTAICCKLHFIAGLDAHCDHRGYMRGILAKAKQHASQPDALTLGPLQNDVGRLFARGRLDGLKAELRQVDAGEKIFSFAKQNG